MALKLNIGDPKSKKTFTKELEDSKALIGKKIHDKVSGSQMGFPGYEFEITGGSDNAGFPMRYDVIGTGRKRILTTRGVGLNAKRKGLRKRVTVAGNQVYSKTAQINMKVLKQGKDPLDTAPAEKAAEKPEGETSKTEAKEEKPAAKEEVKTEKTEAIKEKEEKPKEEAPVEKSEADGTEEKPEDKKDTEKQEETKEKE